MANRTIKDFLVENGALDLWRSFWGDKTEKQWLKFLTIPIFDEDFEGELKNTLRTFIKLDIQRDICKTIVGIIGS